MPRDFLDGYAEMLSEVSETGRLLNRDERDSRRQLGESAAESGYRLRTLIALYLEETRELWATLPGVAGARSGTEARLVGSSVLAAVGAGIDAVAEGYERAQRHAVRQEEAARQEFIDDLLYGRSDPGLLAERAQRFGLRLAGYHSVAVAVGPEQYDETHPVVRRTERELIGRFGERDVLLTTKEGRLVCVASSRETAVLEAFAGLADVRQVALGRAHSGPGGVVRSYEEALSTLDLADRLGLDSRRLNAADLLVFPVLMRDRAAMADLVKSVLGPLTQARGGAEPLLETLAVYSEAGYVGAEAARRLDLSVRALSYRLERVKQLTGFDPYDSLQRFTLETASLGARILDWPSKPL